MRTTIGAWAAALFVSLVMVVLFVLAVIGGRHVMCTVYRDQPDQKPSYCPTAVQR